LFGATDDQVLVGEIVDAQVLVGEDIPVLVEEDTVTTGH